MVRKICKDTFFLSRKAEPATASDLEAAQDLLDTLAAHKDGCVGMAANMIGINKLIIVFDNDGEYMVMFNPVIIRHSTAYEAEEGCLSIPGRWGITHRPRHVTVQCLNRNGETVTYTGHDLLARAFCHELDHLDGKLFIDIAKMED